MRKKSQSLLSQEFKISKKNVGNYLNSEWYLKLLYSFQSISYDFGITEVNPVLSQRANRDCFENFWEVFL